jgi:hypothetical protein
MKPVGKCTPAQRALKNEMNFFHSRRKKKRNQNEEANKNWHWVRPRERQNSYGILLLGITRNNSLPHSPCWGISMLLPSLSFSKHSYVFAYNEMDVSFSLKFFLFLFFPDQKAVLQLAQRIQLTSHASSLLQAPILARSLHIYAQT